MSTQQLSEISVEVREIPAGESLKEFVDLAWTINASDPCWVAPLRMSLNAALDRKKHPFHEHAEVAYFLATRNGEPIGRIAAIHNRLHNEFHGDSLGFFGLFECRDDKVAANSLLDRACRWLAQRGCDRVRGPLNFSTNDEVASPGVLIEGFETPPTLMMGHNPRYYASLIEDAGFEKAKELIAFNFDKPEVTPTRGVGLFERILGRRGVEIRPLNMKRFQQEVDALKEVYNAAWTKNWGFVPMTDHEFQHLAKDFKPIVDPHLIFIAEANGEPIGFALTLPDLNQVLAHIPDGRLFPFGLFKFLWYKRKISRVRLMALGFKPEYHHAGIGAAFYYKNWVTAVGRGYQTGEASWILEDNLEMLRPMERQGGYINKRYRVYERGI
jgi:hypothetical protein